MKIRFDYLNIYHLTNTNYTQKIKFSVLYRGFVLKTETKSRQKRMCDA